MEYILYHKDHPVISVTLNEAYKINKILKVHDEERTPIGLDIKGKLSHAELDEWLYDRAILEDL